MKVSIRDLLLLTAIVALVLGWGMDHFRPGNYHRQLERKIQQLELRAGAMEQFLNQNGWEVEQEEVNAAWKTRIDRKSFQ